MNRADIAWLAELHRECLPRSAVSRLGSAYARSFYRYVSRSRATLLEIERDPEGRIVAAAVVALDPRHLTGRLIWHTTMVWHLLTRPDRTLALLCGRTDSPNPSLPPGERMLADVHDLPELILIFSAQEARSQGIGAKLIARLEERLRRLGVARYQVKTVADPANRALAFYARLGFAPDGVVEKHGQRSRVFTKSL